MDVKKLMFVLVAAALLGAAPAQAKELLGAQLCGPDGCVTQRAGGLVEGPGGPFSGELAKPAKPGQWYRGYLLAGDHGKVVGKMLFYYVPGAVQVVQPGRFGQTTTWTRPDAKLASLVKALAARTKPYGTPTLTSVTLNGTAVDDPQSYMRLWKLGEKATGYPDGLGSQQVIFFTDPASPWSDGNYVVAYAKSRVLLRDGQLVSLPKDVAAAVAAGRSLDPGRSIPWTPIAIAAALAALVLAAALARRLRPRPSPQPVAQA
jgi:hypothetical protein